MDADTVLVSEGLTVEIDGGQGHSGGVQGINAKVRRAAGMGSAADELDALGYCPVVGVANAHLLLGWVTGGVEHHGQMDVVELT